MKKLEIKVVSDDLSEAFGISPIRFKALEKSVLDSVKELRQEEKDFENVSITMNRICEKMAPTTPLELGAICYLTGKFFGNAQSAMNFPTGGSISMISSIDDLPDILSKLGLQSPSSKDTPNKNDNDPGDEECTYNPEDDE